VKLPLRTLGAGGLKLLVLGLTTATLLGHGSGTRNADCSEFPEQHLEYDVMNECGPAGTIELVAMAGSCDFWVEGDEVGIPRVGRREVHGGLLEEGRFGLRADPPEHPQGCTALRKDTEGELTLVCGDPTIDDPEQNCTVVLRRVP
jgi:hypothetical protein